MIYQALYIAGCGDEGTLKSNYYIIYLILFTYDSFSQFWIIASPFRTWLPSISLSRTM